MEHLLLKAQTTVATDEGTFVAVISTATSDREKDIVEPAAMVAALQAWVPTGKMLPLAWNHSSKAEDQIGHIDPASAQDIGGEVQVKGWIDQATEVGAHAWRMVKAGTLGFSFGYLITDSAEIKGGGRHISGMDVFEVTATTTPMNNETRVVSYKAMTSDARAAMAEQMDQMSEMMTQDPMPISDAEMAARMRSMADEMAPAKALNVAPTDTTGMLEELQEVKAQLAESEKALDDLKQSVGRTGKEPSEGVRLVDPLIARADAVALEVMSGGESLRKPPRAKKQAPPERDSENELRRRAHEQMLDVLSGGTTHESV